jgi:hypothetical protein
MPKAKAIRQPGTTRSPREKGLKVIDPSKPFQSKLMKLQKTFLETAVELAKRKRNFEFNQMTIDQLVNMGNKKPCMYCIGVVCASKAHIQAVCVVKDVEINYQ